MHYISSIDMSRDFFSNENVIVVYLIHCIQYMLQNLQIFMASNGVLIISNCFQLLIDRILNGLSFRRTLCYIDDVPNFSETFEQNMQDLQ